MQLMMTDWRGHSLSNRLDSTDDYITINFIITIGVLELTITNKIRKYKQLSIFK